MKGLTPHHAAAIEAFEEAGIVGKVARVKVGRFKHRKSIGSKTITCAVDVFPLAVEDNLDRWPEKRERKRRWFSGKDAAARVRPKGLQRAIRDLQGD